MTSTPKSEASLLKEISGLRAKISRLEKANVSHRKKLEIQKKNLERYEYAADGANDGLWDWNLITNETFVSSPWKKMLGYKEIELNNGEGNNVWKELLHPEDYEYATEAFEDYVSGETERYEIEFRLKHRNGTYRWIFSKGKVLKDENGNVLRVSGSHTDITERKKAEAALINSERKFRHLFENSLVGMIRTNKKGQILEANNTAYKIFGVKQGAEMNAIDYYVDTRDRDQLFLDLEEKGVLESREMQFKKYDGTLFWANYSAVLYKEEEFIEVVIIDITETKENLLELQKVNLELDNFVYHASHDLRSPLRSILGLVNILRMEKISKGQENCIELIEGSIKRMDKLVVDLLSISRNSRINDPYVPLNFMEEINNSITNFYHVSKNKNLQIITKVYQPVNFICDLTRIRIILNNLISNAIKYRSYGRNFSFIDIEVHVDREKAVIVIEDNGEGIPESKLPNIFDMFVRASESSEGSGLGLYIVKDVIGKLYGKIELSSKENVGTTFRLEIPNGHLTSEQ